MTHKLQLFTPILFLLVAAASVEARQTTQPFHVTGKVTTADGAPVAGAKVTARCGVGTLRPTGSATTDEHGAFDLRFGPSMIMDRGAGNGSVGFQAATIFVTLAGHFERNLCRDGNLAISDLGDAEEEEASRRNQYAAILHAEQTKELNFVMLPAASISGQLNDPDGKPIADYSVCLAGEHLPPSSSVLACARTDAAGRFSFADVPTNFAWKLSVSARGNLRKDFPCDEELAFPDAAAYDVQLKLAGDRLTASVRPR